MTVTTLVIAFALVCLAIAAILCAVSWAITNEFRRNIFPD